jgi:hypothetical protein
MLACDYRLIFVVMCVRRRRFGVKFELSKLLFTIFSKIKTENSSRTWDIFLDSRQ